MPNDLADLIADRRRPLEKLAQSLIHIPTVNPPGEHYAECTALLKTRLDEMGMKTQVHRVPDRVRDRVLPDCTGYRRYNVIARLDVGAPKTVHFNAHYDVVPVSGNWLYDPFEAKIDDDWLYGRGAADMKGMIAACMIAVETLHKAGIEPKVNIEMSFTADEEIGGELGAGYVVKNKLIHADYAIVCEGGFENKVGVGHNGILWLDVKLRGKSGHAAHPHRGINAFEQAAALAVELARVKPKLARRSFTGPNDKAKHPTINIGGVFGQSDGGKVNTIPGDAHFTIDRRVIPSEEAGDAEKELRDIIRGARAKIDHFKPSIDKFLDLDPCVVDHTLPMPQAFSRSVKAVRGGRPKFQTTPGFTDLHYFINEGGMTGVGYGARGRDYHGVNERIRISELVKLANIYAHFLTTFEG